MKFKRISVGLLFAAITMVGCASATVTEPSACDTQSVSFNSPIPTLPGVNCSTLPSVSIPEVSKTTQMDLSDTVSKLKDLANNLNVDITSFDIDNSQHQFDWVNELDVTVSSGTLPSALLAKYVRPSTGALADLQPQLVMSADDTLKYLSSGALDVTVTLVSQTMTACQVLAAANALHNVSTVETSTTMCISASGQVTKSL